MGWLSDWGYRKSITLSRASGVVSNYQMKLLVGENSGATGEEVDCGGKCLSSFDDLRFTKADGTTLLDYWIESITGDAPNQLATVWIKFDSIGTDATTFFMYYGNNDAGPVSNGANTFIAFDDFERGIDGDTIGGDWTEEVAHVHISTTQQYAGTRAAQLIGSAKASIAIAPSDNISIQLRLYRSDLASINGIRHGNGSKEIYLAVDGDGVLYYANNYSNFIEIGSFSAEVWNWIEINNINWTAGTNDIWFNGVKIASNVSISTAYNANANKLGITGHYTSGLSDWMDNVIVRNWRATEPVWGAWGSEQPMPPIITSEIAETAVISDVVEGMRLAENQSESAEISAVFDPMLLSEVQAETVAISDEMKGSDLYGAMSETANIGDVFIDNYETGSAVAESAAIGDVFLGEHFVLGDINDGLVLGDNSHGLSRCYISIAESLDIADEVIRLHPKTINDLLFIYDTLIHGWGVTTEESLELTDSLSIVLGLMISDWLTLLDSQSNNWNGQEILNDRLNLYDIAEKYFDISDTIDESLVLTDANSYALIVAVLEYLGFNDLVSAMNTMTQSISDGFAAIDTADNAWAMVIEETLQAVDAATVIAAFVQSVQDSLSVADAASFTARINAALNESLVLVDTHSVQGTLYTTVYDTLKMEVLIELAGEVYECYVLNTPKFQPSMYSGFNFNSYCVFENRAFGANDTGIFELTGSTDAGATIHTGAILNETDFGSRHQKRFRRGYLGISGTSPVMVMETEDGSRQVYTVDEDGKVVFQHDQKSKKWKLSVADFDTLETMQLVPIILTR